MADSRSSGPRLVLVGMMGSGKTSVGRLLSDRTGWPYLDNDDLVEAATGQTARDLAHESPEVLRRAERDAFLRGLEVPPPVILGAAGAIVLEPDVAELLRGSFVVWLRASPEVLAARAARGAHRPWLDADPESWIQTADAERATAYRRVASMDVWTDELSPSEVVDVIIGRIR